MNHKFGTMADLARELGVSRSAISKAFKKHSIQRSSDGVYNIDYMKWLLSEKQESARSAGQRSARRKPAGLHNPQLRREVLRGLAPIWQAAILKTLTEILEGVVDDAEFDDEAVATIRDYFYCLSQFWDWFHLIADQELQRDPADLDFEKPAAICLQADTDAGLLDQVITVCKFKMDVGNEMTDMPLEQLEALVIGGEDLGDA